MKKTAFMACVFISFLSFSQKKVLKKIQSDSKQIEFYTAGLDDFVLENSTSNFIEIILFAENPLEKHIIFNDDENVANISFQFNEIPEDETVFRKFITKRLERARAIIKIPKDKKVIIFGENINIESKNYTNEISIFIEKGIVKLNEIQANTEIKIYAGTIFANLKKTNIDVVSNIGKISVDSILYDKKYQIKNLEFKKELKITSVKANIFLTTK
ncbi:MAG: hypothetical protein WAO74_00915 [Polaribacter sp.]|uniref:hypothetical protein n=1 Tax=Polaribacter sp. TaxID=1920175 RepID=UPI003BB1E012